MYWKLSQLLFSCLFVCSTSARSVTYKTVEGDTVTVGSYIREVRTSMPLKVAEEIKDLTSADNTPKSGMAKKRMKNISGKSDEGGYYRTYGGDAEGEKGYSKETYGKGDQGYKTLDTFHKQDGDKYEFETQIIYGKNRADKKDGKHRNEKKNKDHESAGTIVDTDYAGDEGEHDEAGGYSHYTRSDDDDHDDDGYSSYYTEEKMPKSSSYSYSENYSSGDGDKGSYEKHSSYKSDDNGEAEQEEDYY